MPVLLFLAPIRRRHTLRMVGRIYHREDFYMDIMVVINQMVMLFIIILIGYLIVKAGFVDMDFQKKLSNFILQVTMPMMMLGSVSDADSRGAGQKLLQIFFIAVLVFTVMPFVGKLIARVLNVPKNQRDAYIFLSVFSNLGFMGFPVIASIFGPDALVYAIIFNLVFSLVQFTYGISLFSGSKASLHPKTFLTPGVMASVLSIIMFLSGIKITGPVGQAIKSVGSVTTPLAMIVIGISLSGIPLKEVFAEKRLYLFTLIKQLILPALAFFLLRLVITDPLIIGVSVIVIAMPSATMAVILANNYNHHIGLTTRAVFLTTLASVVTIPAIAFLLAM